MKKRPGRMSGMTPEAMIELERRIEAGEDISGMFSLETGKSIKQSPEMAAINAELAALKFE